MSELIKQYFTESIQTQIVIADSLSHTIDRAGSVIVSALLNGNKVLCLGHGSATANAQNFVARLINGFEIERPSLPAISLVSDSMVLSGSSHSGDAITRQIQALGNAGDILVAISSEGNCQEVSLAVQAADIKDMLTIALTGGDGGELPGLLGRNDIEIRIPSYKEARIQEMHMLVINGLCHYIDNTLFMSAE